MAQASSEQRQHRAEEHPGGQLDLVDLAVAQGADHEVHLGAQLGGNIGAQAVLVERQHGLAGLLDGDAGAQAGEGAQEGTGVGGARKAGVQALGQEDVGVAELRHLEALGQDADDADELLVHFDGPVQDAGIAAQGRAPERVREERHGRRAGAIVGRGEIAAKRRGEAEQAHEVGFHVGAGDAARAAGELQIALLAGAHGGHGLKRRLQTAPIQVAADHVEFVVVDRAEKAHRDELSVVGIRQAAEEQRVHHTEDGRGGADPDGDGGYGDGSEGRRFAESAEGVAGILCEGFPEGGDVNGTHVFERSQRSAEIAAGQQAGGIGSSAAAAMPLLAEGLVGIEFLAPFGFAGLRLRRVRPPEPGEEFHAKRSTFRTPLATAVQLVSASARRRRPAGVRV